MERLCGRWSAMIAWLGNMQARQLTELYRALRLYVNCFQPMVLLQAKQRDGKKVRYVYDSAKTPLQSLLLSGVLFLLCCQLLSCDFTHPFCQLARLFRGRLYSGKASRREKYP
jgi:hypothetical protein